MKKILIILTAIILSTSLISCNSETNNPVETDVVTTDAPKIEIPRLQIATGHSTKYSVVFAEKASQAVQSSALTFIKRLDRYVDLTSTSEKFKPVNDWYMPNKPPKPEDPEILIGLTNRQESIDVYSTIRENTYVIKVVNNKIVIAASDDNLIPYALTYFENKILLDKNYVTKGEFSMPGDFNVEVEYNNPDFATMLKSSMHISAEYTKVFEHAGLEGHKYTQGAATDGTHFYISMHNKDSAGVESTIITKVKMSDMSVVKSSKILSLTHCNDICYNPDTNKLVVADMNGSQVTIIDPETLEITQRVNLPTQGVVYAITYNAKRKQYLAAAGGKFNIFDNDFNLVDASASVPATPTYVGQGMDSDDNYIYIPRSMDTAKGTNDNIVLILDWNFNLLKTATITTKMESETMFNFDGKYYCTFNNWGSGKIIQVCEIEYKLAYN